MDAGLLEVRACASANTALRLMYMATHFDWIMQGWMRLKACDPACVCASDSLSLRCLQRRCC
jgi:hypothetical protein